MKTFIIALCVLALLISAIIINSFFVCGALDELEALAQSMPDTPEDADASELAALWEEKQDLICISVSHVDADRLELALEDIKAGISCSDAGIYLAGKLTVLAMLSDMRDAEQLSLERVF